MAKKEEISSTQEHLPIAAILDGVVLLKNGKFCQIIMVSSLNFALKSEREQNALIFQYQNFLNSLTFPIQILVQSRRLDLKPYLDNLKEKERQEQNPLLQVQIAYYIEFVERLISLGNIMSKKFFVVVPYSQVGLKKESIFEKTFHPAAAPSIKISKPRFEAIKQEIRERVNVVLSGLSSLGLKAVPLNTQQTIELLYSIYNPEEAVEERLVEEESLEAKVVHAPAGPEASLQVGNQAGSPQPGSTAETAPPQRRG